MLLATSYPLIFESFPATERGFASGLTTTAWAVGSAAGPILGGLFAVIDWRLIFYVNVPISAAAVILGLRRLPARLDTRSPDAGEFNLVSTALLAVTVSTFILYVTYYQVEVIPFALSSALLFLLNEAKSSRPLIDRRLIRNRGFVYSTLGVSLVIMAFYGLPFVMTFYLQSVAGLTPLIAGLWLTPIPLTLCFSSPLGGRLFDRMSRPGKVAILGTFFMLAACIALTFTMVVSQPSILILPLLGLAGLGCGLAWSPTLASALEFSAPPLRGLASGTVFTVRSVSFAASVAITISVFAGALPSSLAGQVFVQSLSGFSSEQASLLISGLSRALLVLVGVSAVGLPALLVVYREQRERSRAPLK